LQTVGKRIYASMDKETEALVVNRRLARIYLKRRIACARSLFWKVFARVEIFDYGSHGIGVAVCKDNLTWLERISYWFESMYARLGHTPRGSKFSICLANSGDLTRTALCAEYVVRASDVPTTTSTIGLFMRLDTYQLQVHYECRRYLLSLRILAVV